MGDKLGMIFVIITCNLHQGRAEYNPKSFIVEKSIKNLDNKFFFNESEVWHYERLKIHLKHCLLLKKLYMNPCQEYNDILLDKVSNKKVVVS